MVLRCWAFRWRCRAVVMAGVWWSGCSPAAWVRAALLSGLASKWLMRPVAAVSTGDHRSSVCSSFSSGAAGGGGQVAVLVSSRMIRAWAVAAVSVRSAIVSGKCVRRGR